MRQWGRSPFATTVAGLTARLAGIAAINALFVAECLWFRPIDNAQVTASTLAAVALAFVLFHIVPTQLDHMQRSQGRLVTRRQDLYWTLPSAIATVATLFPLLYFQQLTPSLAVFASQVLETLFVGLRLRRGSQTAESESGKGNRSPNQNG